MVEINVCNQSNSGLRDVGGVETTAHPNFEDREIHPRSREIEEGGRG